MKPLPPDHKPIPGQMDVEECIEAAGKMFTNADGEYDDRTGYPPFTEDGAETVSYDPDRVTDDDGRPRTDDPKAEPPKPLTPAEVVARRLKGRPPE